MRSTISDPRSIEHVPLGHVENLEAEMRGTVLNNAFETFGYRSDKFSDRGKLAAAMVELKIEALDPQQVKFYMESKRATWRTHKAVSFFRAVAVQCAIFMSLIIGLMKIWPGIAGMAFQITMGVSFAITLFIVAIATSEIGVKQYERDWLEYSLDKNSPTRNGVYDRFVPVFILNLALQLKEKVPNAKFMVCELTTSVSNVPKPDPDPFIYVEWGSEKYYFGVWDEKEFVEKK